MKKYICDRCKKEIGFFNRNSMQLGTFNYDFCQKCRKAIEDVIDGKEVKSLLGGSNE